MTFALPIRLNHLLCMFPGGIRELGPAQHARHFLSTLLSYNKADASPDSAAALLLFDHVVMIGKSCDLRKMGDTQNLI